MKKTILSAIAVCDFAFSAQAQIDFGLRAGVNFTDMKIKDIGDKGTYTEIANGGMNFGYHGGAYINFNLLLLKIQPEFLYTRVNGSLTGIDASGKAFDEVVGVNRVDIPLNILFGLGPIRFGAGPVYSYQFSSAGEFVSFSGFNNGVWNAQVLAGLELGKIQLDLRYQFGLTDALDVLSLPGSAVEASATPSQIIVALGLDLGFLIF